MSDHYKNLLRTAQQEGYAIPAFNYTDSCEFLAIAEAAAELKAPVYAASAKITVDAMGLDICGVLGVLEHKKASGYFFNHLDHCTSVDICKAAVDVGYQSVMFDGSKLPLEENIARTRQVVDYARRKSVFTEGEVGQILGKSDEGAYLGGAYMVTTQDCVRMAEEGGVDSLAIGIGNQHGFYTAPPNLNIPLLAEVHRLLDIPLVLHGSSGLEESVVLECIRNGICKVNVGTELHRAYKCRVAEVIQEDPTNYAVTTFSSPAKEAIKEVVRRWIKLCGAEGKRR